ncbi:carbohydrate ABC transporter permease, partial [Priestia filamentosa]
MEVPKQSMMTPETISDVKRVKRKKGYKSVTFVYTGLIFYFLIIAYPLLWMVMSSFKSTEEIFTNSWSLPETWLVENYVAAWESGISSYFLNSVIVTGLSCILTIFVSALGAYGLSRFEFKGKTFILVICLGGLMLSPQVSLIPLY